jgi:ADP-dependent NAD(P)H-hydrate dehydratase / NAD(P)H-hydrate epimerase
MRQAHEVAKVRAAEQALMARLGPDELMRRAAFGLASVCARLLDGAYGAQVVVLAGSGDNGGDALYAGALLARRGATVRAVAAGSRIHQGGADALKEAGGRLHTPDDQAVPGLIEDADLIIDGMLGIGGRGGLREPYLDLAVQAADSPGLVVAVDLPSGIDADTGVLEGPAVRADVTVTFGTWKPGLLVDPGASLAGLTELVDIGLGPELAPPDLVALQSADVAALLPAPGAESDKYRRGVLGVVAGSELFTGAAWLATGAAIRGGAGMVRLVSAAHAAEVVRNHWPEAVITVAGPDDDPGEVLKAAGRVQAWTAGPGMGTDEKSATLLAAVLASDLPALVDADGLTLVARDRSLLDRDAPTLLTPHAGELARLLGADRDDVEARRLEHVRRAADELGATVLLKGSTTVIAEPGGRAPVWVNPTGTAWLATAGSGDVLSGLGGALLAQGLSPADAAAVAAYLHGLAGRLAAAGADGAGHVPGVAAPIGAADVLHALPAAIRSVQEAGGGLE